MPSFSHTESRRGAFSKKRKHAPKYTIITAVYIEESQTDGLKSSITLRLPIVDMLSKFALMIQSDPTATDVHATPYIPVAVMRRTTRVVSSSAFSISSSGDS